jgi:hypothetical protein
VAPYVVLPRNSCRSPFESWPYPSCRDVGPIVMIRDQLTCDLYRLPADIDGTSRPFAFFLFISRSEDINHRRCMDHRSLWANGGSLWMPTIAVMAGLHASRCDVTSGSRSRYGVRLSVASHTFLDSLHAPCRSAPVVQPTPHRT